MSNPLLRKISIKSLNDKASTAGGARLRRALSPTALIVIGVGCIVGAGLFSVTGAIAAYHSGPAITLCFLLAALSCALTGLCYAELASRIPVSGSAYTYAYASIGELPAWIVGWNLVLEYLVGAIVVCASWSQYLVVLLRAFGIVLPEKWTSCPAEGGFVNLPAIGIVLLMSIFLIRGVKQSAWANNLIVFVKMSIIVVFIVLGWRYINTDNLTPYLPANTGEFGSYGVSGIFRGAGIAFFAFLGFDAVSTLAQETRNPARSMPIGILGSLFVVAIIYILFGYVLTGVAHYTEFQGQDSIAPVAVAISHMPWPWLNKLIIVAILFGYSSVILVMLMAQSRVFMTMGKDGILPAAFSHVHPRWHTPWKSSLVVMLCVALLGGFVPGRIAGEMCSIGTLLAFLLVCASVIVLHRRDKRSQLPHPRDEFRTPWVPFIPICGMLVCFVLMLSLPADTWLRLLVWTIIGIVIYFCYSRHHSHLK